MKPVLVRAVWNHEYQGAPFISDMRCLSVSSMCFFFSSHSHTVITFHPAPFSWDRFLTSLSLFPLILSLQNSVLVFGITKYLQSWWPCQKQPFTKIAVLYFFSTISGFPGSFLTLILYLKPFLKSNFLRSISGLVSLPLICCILYFRCAEVWRSDIKCKVYLIFFR